MGQSLVKNYLHIVFSTKYRQPLIYSPYEKELHAYLGGICKKQECYPLKIGGYTDHVHILCMLSKKLALMKLMEDLKSHSSKWFKTKDKSLEDFYWQDGYGAFSVDHHQVEKIIPYIANQHEHHKSQDFKDEFRGLMKKYEIAYDERYIWD